MRHPIRFPSLPPARIVLAGALCLVLCLAQPRTADAALVTVGSNAETCDYTSLAFAIAFADSGDVLVVEGKTWTHISGVNFNLFDKSLTITGGFDADCTGTEIDEPTTLRGLGAGASVLQIRSADPASVILANLVIEYGSSTSGGGLHVSGDVSVLLAEVRVQDNVAEAGGGIFLDGSQGASMTLTVGTSLLRNTASGSGGGLLCVAGAALDIAHGVDISYNTADEGGGLQLSDCGVTISAAGGDPDRPTWITGNSAVEGGGIFVGPGGDLVADGGPWGNLSIIGNEAVLGGAVRLEGGPTSVRMSRALIAANRATQGAAISNSGAAFYLEPPKSGCNIYPCSLVASNGDVATEGGVFWVRDGHISLVSTGLRNNSGSPAIGSLEGFSSLTLEGAEVTGHVGAGDSAGMTISGDSYADFLGVTFGDQVAMDRLVAGTGSLDANAIIAAGSPTDLFDPQLSWDLDCAVLTAGLPGGPHPWVSNVLVTSDPGFDDRYGGGYRLLPGSVAVNRCGDLGAGLDVEGRDRPEGLGWDAGSFELPSVIFSDGFESGDVTAWSNAI